MSRIHNINNWCCDIAHEWARNSFIVWTTMSPHNVNGPMLPNILICTVNRSRSKSSVTGSKLSVTINFGVDRWCYCCLCDTWHRPDSSIYWGSTDQERCKMICLTKINTCHFHETSKLFFTTPKSTELPSSRCYCLQKNFDYLMIRWPQKLDMR